MIVEFWYTNWKGSHRLRRVLPHKIRFDSTIHHPDPQWLLDAMDLDCNQPRTFALKDIEGPWVHVENSSPNDPMTEEQVVS